MLNVLLAGIEYEKETKFPMNNIVQTIPLFNLSLAFIPVFIVVGIFIKWRLSFGDVVYAIARMITQLLLVGYFLAYIFGAQDIGIILSLLVIMIAASGWIALRTIKPYRLALLQHALISIFIGGTAILWLVLQGVLTLSPWYQTNYLIPIAGMIFAAAMNSVSLAADRFSAELSNHQDYTVARNIAFKASLIPNVNALFAVGLVTLPGMMTGQILAGVSPLVASRYQIMVMCMVFAAAGLAAAIFLVISKNKFISIHSGNKVLN